MSMNEALAMLAEALQVDAGQVDASTALGHTIEWDSLAHMRLILALEDCLGRALVAEEILAVASLEDVVAVLGSRL